MIVAAWLTLQLALPTLIIPCADPVPAPSTQSSSTATATVVTGTVRDILGRVVAEATVIVRESSGAERQTVSGADGRFQVDAARPGAILIVRAAGFEETRQSIPVGSDHQNVEIVLSPAAVSENVTVTASRVEQQISNVAASINVLGKDTVRHSPAVVADDVLRQVPTFSLFRRASSLASHPTAQGVSLRGIGPSGVSRTLVLLDGVPFNDPFGGWVYWTRVPLGSVDRIELVDSSSSSLYGNYAMGGVINIMTVQPARRTVEISTQYGSRNSPKLDFSGSDVWGKASVSLDASVFDTDGYPIVAAAERGLVDNKASVTFRNFNLKLRYQFTDRVQAFVRGGYFREERDNGKASTIDQTEEANDTTWRTASGGVRIRMPDESDLQLSVFTDLARFHSNFLAVPAATPPRSIGRMTLNQTVPTTGIGGMAQWSRPFGGHQFFSAGTDWRRVDGDSREDGLDSQFGTRVTLKRVSGGTQRSVGVFAQDLITPVPRLVLTLSARLDYWKNYDAHNLETNFPSGTPTANHQPALPSRDDRVVSPRAAALYHVADWLSVWGNLGWGFRAPTLNELYRQFRVGTVLTLANNQLGPERLVGGDVGIRIAPAPNLTWRTTWFENRVKDPVSNVTRSIVGTNVTQQRQNLGKTRIWGVQTDVEYRAARYWKITGGYLYDQAKVREFAENPALVGKFLAQVPQHRGSLQLAFSNPRLFSAAVIVEAVGSQFDDDLNMRIVPGRQTPGLPGYALVELTASRAVGRNVEVFAGAQNAFNHEYFVGTLPTTIGTPRLISVGVRLRFSPENATK